jgi:hypothetical protein
MNGYVSGLSGLTAGTTYYLDASTAGALTSTEPLTTGYISKPVLIADSTTSGYVIESRGIQNAAGVSLPVSDWTAYTPTFTGFGTVSTSAFYWRRNGDSIEIEGTFTSGSSTATEARVTLPNGLVSDSTKIPAIRMCGIYLRDETTTSHGGTILIEPNVSYFTFGSADGFSGNSTNSISKANGLGIGSVFKITGVKIPISGWSSGAGTSPTLALSDWRSYPVTITASTTNPSLGTTTLNQAFWRRVGDSMEIVYDLQQTSAGSAGSGTYLINLPSGYTIDSSKININSSHHGSYVGNFSITNNADELSASAIIGRVMPYNTTNLSAVMITSGSTMQPWNNNNYHLGNTVIQARLHAYVPISGWTSTSAGTLTAPRSEVIVDTGNGLGSTNTRVVRFTNTQKNIGPAITYADSAANGGSFTINETGVYAIAFHSGSAGASTALGITVNGSALTTDPGSLTYAQGLRALSWAAVTSQSGQCHYTGNLNSGDVVRFHTENITPFTSAKTMASITKVSN